MMSSPPPLSSSTPLLLLLHPSPPSSLSSTPLFSSPHSPPSLKQTDEVARPPPPPPPPRLQDVPPVLSHFLPRCEAPPEDGVVDKDLPPPRMDPHPEEETPRLETPSAELCLFSFWYLRKSCSP
ncbi:unnamed protein product [Gadus morhua 'NCC']